MIHCSLKLYKVGALLNFSRTCIFKLLLACYNVSGRLTGNKSRSALYALTKLNLLDLTKKRLFSFILLQREIMFVFVWKPRTLLQNYTVIFD